jgi:hypothetical protein
LNGPSQIVFFGGAVAVAFGAEGFTGVVVGLAGVDTALAVGSAGGASGGGADDVGASVVEPAGGTEEGAAVGCAVGSAEAEAGGAGNTAAPESPVGAALVEERNTKNTTAASTVALTITTRATTIPFRPEPDPAGLTVGATAGAASMGAVLEVVPPDGGATLPRA